MLAPLYDGSGSLKGEVELPNSFEGEINEAAIHAACVTILANQRTGSASTKGKAEVSGGGAKPWRQKGIGRARAGSIRSPIWRGGGRVFGPKPRSYAKRLPKKTRRLALWSALRSKAQEGELALFEEPSLDGYSTKTMAALLRAMDVAPDESTLLVLSDYSDLIHRSTRNIPRVDVDVWRRLNAYSVMTHHRIILLHSVLASLEEEVKQP